MPFLCEVDAGSIRPTSEPRHDTVAAVTFPHPLVARPRLPHGLRLLDVDKHFNIRAKSAIPYFTHTWADCHITSWDTTRLHNGVAHILALAPADLEFLTGEHIRHSGDPSSVRITFERRFVTPPKVVVFFNYVDLDTYRNWRLNVSSSDVDVNGFTLHIETWGDTILYGAQACWIAYPEDRPHIFSTSVNTMDVRPMSRPQHQHSKNIAFGEVEFWKDPSVFVALNYLDINCTRNLRVQARVTGVSKTGLVSHIDSWGDTIMYATGASIIAFN